MLRTSDQVAKIAYSRMLLNTDHLWARIQRAEARFIASLDGLVGGASILDFGCGRAPLPGSSTAMGYRVKGVDYLDGLVNEHTNSRHGENSGVPNSRSQMSDSRSGRQFDLVLCL